MSSRPSSRVRFDETELELQKREALERAASRGSPDSSHGTSKFFANEFEAPGSRISTPKEAIMEQGSPSDEQKVEPAEGGNVDWLSLAMDDGEEAKDDGISQKVSDLAEVDEMSEMDDADFLAQFNKRWNSNSNLTKMMEESESEAPIRETDSPATATSDLSSEIMASTENSNSIASEERGSASPWRESEPVAPGLESNNEPEPREEVESDPKPEPEPEPALQPVDSSKFFKKTAAPSVSAEAERSTGTLHGKDSSDDDDEEEKIEKRKEKEAAEGMGEQKDKDKEEDRDKDKEKEKDKDKDKEEDKDEDKEEEDLLEAIERAQRADFESLMHDLVGGGASEVKGHMVKQNKVDMKCWRCSHGLAVGHLFCQKCGAKNRNKGYDASNAATPSSSITGVTVGGGIDGDMTISTMGGYSASSLDEAEYGDVSNLLGHDPARREQLDQPSRKRKGKSKGKMSPQAAPLPPTKPAHEPSGLEEKRSRGKREAIPGVSEDSTVTGASGPRRSGAGDPAAELQRLPPKLVEALNTLRGHLNSKARQEKIEKELQYKEQLVLSMEMEHALALEDTYMNVASTQFGHNPDKVKPNPGIVFAKPSAAAMKIISASGKKNGGFPGSSASLAGGSTLSSIGVEESQAPDVQGVLGPGSAESSVFGDGSLASHVETGQGHLDLGQTSLSSEEKYLSVFDEIDKSGSIHSRSNLWDPLGAIKAEMEDKLTQGGQYNFDGSINHNGSLSASSSVSGTGTGATGASTSIYSHENRPVGLAKLQAEYKEIDRNLPRVTYSSTKEHMSIPMPSYVRPKPLKAVNWEKDKIEALALQSRGYQVVHSKGVTREKELAAFKNFTPVGTVVVDEEWKSWKPTDRPYLGDSESDRENSKTRWPMKSYSYVTSYLDEVPSIMVYFDAWFQRERELTNPLGSSDGGKYLVSQGATESSANYHYLRYLKAMKREDRRKRAAAEANISQLYDQALQREKSDKELWQKQEEAKANEKKEKEEEEKEQVLEAEAHLAGGAFFWGGAPTLEEREEEELAKHLEREEEQETNKDKAYDTEKVRNCNDIDYTEGGSKAFWWGPLKAKGRFLLPSNLRYSSVTGRSQEEGGLDERSENVGDKDSQLSTATSLQGSTRDGGEATSVASGSLGTAATSESGKVSRREKMRRANQAAKEAHDLNPRTVYAGITGNTAFLPPYPRTPGGGLAIPDQRSFPGGGYDTFGGSGLGYGAPQVTPFNADDLSVASHATPVSVASAGGAVGDMHMHPIRSPNTTPGYLADTATTQDKTYFSRPGTSTMNTTVGDLTIRGVTPVVHHPEEAGQQRGGRDSLIDVDKETMFMAFAAQDNADSSMFLPKNDPHGFSEQYGNIDKYYGGTLDDESESEGEEEREARMKKEHDEIMRIAMKEELKKKKRDDKIALMRKHGLLGSDEEPTSSDDESEASTDVDTPPISPRLLTPTARSSMHKDRLEAQATPMVWTQVLQPDGPAGFDDDVKRGLERPLTPEPTSDDEDAAFEAELKEMEAKEAAEKEARERKLRGEKDEEAHGAKGMEDEEGSEVDMTASVQGSMPSSKPGSKAGSRSSTPTPKITTSRASPRAESGSPAPHVGYNTGNSPPRDELARSVGGSPTASSALAAHDTKGSQAESPSSPPSTLPAVAAATKGAISVSPSPAAVAAVEKGNRFEGKDGEEEEHSEDIVPDKVIAQRKAERKAYLQRMRKNLKFSAVYNIDGNSNAKLEPIFRQNPDPVRRAEDNKSVKGMMPSEKGHAIMARLYKKSTSKLRDSVVTPNNIQLTSDPISDDPNAPWSLAWDRVEGYRFMTEQIDEALIQAPILDATARKEYISFCNELAARRAKAAQRVSEALKLAAHCQERYDKKHDELIERLQAAETSKKQKIKDFVAKVKATLGAELLDLGEKVVAAQQAEEVEVAECRSLEETSIRVLQKWRPQHAQLFEEAKLVKFRLEALIKIICVRIIQRTARRRLLMYYRGTPEELEDDKLADLERRMLAKKKKVYKMRPW